MKTLLAVACTSLWLLLTAQAATPAGTTQNAGAAKTPVGTLRLQQSLFARRNWTALWLLYSPRFRDRCNRATWVREIKQARQVLSKLTVRVTRVRTRGNVAFLSYTLTGRGTVLERARKDKYVRIRGRWYDEVDRYTTC